jgi:uncharacterized protein YndB with AHSA1/START domain
MYTINIILVIIGAFITLPLLLAAFSPARFMITRNVIINAPKIKVFDYLRLLRNAENYNKWVMTDPKMKKEFRGTDGQTGFVYAWDSKNKQVRKGEQEIIKIDEGKRIDYEIRFKKPFKANSQTWFIIETVSENETQVTWVFSGSNNYRMRVLHVMMNLKKVLGNDMKKSLHNLKKILEK